MEGRLLTIRLHRDDAVSPVIGTILMVAIAVVLAATVYAWVAGPGAEDTPQPKALTLSSNTPVVAGVKEFAIASASPGTRWDELLLTLDGTPLAYDGALGDDGEYCVASPGMSCVAGTAAPATLIVAGDLVRMEHATLSGRTLRIVDPAANAVVLTLTLR